MFSSGLPTGLPPELEPAIITRVAPEECLAYASWTGMAQPNPQSTNEIERLAAEPSVQEFFGSLAEQIGKYTANNEDSLSGKVMPIGKIILTEPTCAYLGQIGLEDDGVVIDAGLVVKADDNIDALKKQVTALEMFLEQKWNLLFETITIDNTQWRALELKDIHMDLIWGTKGNTMIVGVGKKSIENILARAKTPAPEWLTNLRIRADVSRPGSTFFVNVKKILPIVTSNIASSLPRDSDGNPFNINKLYKACGIDNVKSVGMVSGLDDTGVLSRTIVTTDGPPHGALGLIAEKPLQQSDLAVIPADATFAMAVRQSPENWFAHVAKAVQSIDPGIERDLHMGVKAFNREIGLDLEKDIIAPMGDKIRVYNSPEEGGFVVTGLTCFIDLKDPKVATATVEKIMVIANTNMSRHRWEGKKQIYKGNTIYTFRDIKSGDYNDPKFTPSVCIRGDEMVISLQTACLKSALSRPKDFKSITDIPQIQTLFADGGAPSMVYYENTPEIVRLAYPLMMLFSGIFSDDDFGPLSKMDWTKLPPTREIYPHLKPSVSSVRRTNDGLEVTSRSTFLRCVFPLML